MALIHGSRGFIYFVHQFKPKFREPALLDDPAMLEAVTALNRQITDLAPVLNSPGGQKFEGVSSENPAVPVAARLTPHDGASYLFAVAMREGATTATFQMQDLAGNKTVEVIGEQRSLECKNGSFKDHFDRWAVHLYRVRF